MAEIKNYSYQNNNNNSKLTGHNINQLLQTASFPIRIKVVANTDHVPLGLDAPQENNIQTIVTCVRVHVVKCVNNRSEHVYLPADFQKPLLITQIEQQDDFLSVYDVMKEKKRLSWLLVSKRFDYKGTAYEVGDILEVVRTSFVKRIVQLLCRRHVTTRLPVIIHPNKQKQKLPTYVQGHFKKCHSPRLSYHSLLRDLVTNRRIPFLVTMPLETGFELGEDMGLGELGQRLIALDDMSYDILFIADDRGGLVVQAIPMTSSIRVFLLDQHNPRNNNLTHNLPESRHQLVQNIHLLQCMPVNLTDLFPGEEGQQLTATILQGSSKENPVSGCGCPNTSRQLNIHDMNDTHSFPFGPSPKPTIPEKPKQLKTSSITEEAVYYRFKECPPVPQAITDSANNHQPSLYLQPHKEIPVYDPSNQRAPNVQVEVEIQLDDDSGKTGKHDSIKSVLIGRDGYVIVPSVDGDETVGGDRNARHFNKVQCADVGAMATYELMNDVNYCTGRCTCSSGVSYRLSECGAITDGSLHKLSNTNTEVDRIPETLGHITSPSSKVPKFRPPSVMNIPPKVPALGVKCVRNIGPYENLTKPPIMPKPKTIPPR